MKVVMMRSMMVMVTVVMMMVMMVEMINMVEKVERQQVEGGGTDKGDGDDTEIFSPQHAPSRTLPQCGPMAVPVF